MEPDQLSAVSLGNSERVALWEEDADATHTAQVTVSLKRPTAGSSTCKVVEADAHSGSQQEARTQCTNSYYVNRVPQPHMFC